MWFLLTPTNSSLPSGCPTIQFPSDTPYPELAQTLWVWVESKKWKSTILNFGGVTWWTGFCLSRLSAEQELAYFGCLAASERKRVNWLFVASETQQCCGWRSGQFSAVRREHVFFGLSLRQEWEEWKVHSTFWLFRGLPKRLVPVLPDSERW